jgi:threonine synthase
MQLYSTNHRSPEISFREALLQGLAGDRGLYLPKAIPSLSKAEIASFRDLDYPGIALAVGNKFLSDEIPSPDLEMLVRDAYDYSVPLEHVTQRQYVMRLDQGPTASFKDFAARLMGRLMQYFLRQSGGRLLILTATSGDTGSAIANAFYGLDDIEVVVIYPEKEVTARQRKQMTTLGQNVRTIAIDGKFDDCQKLVKTAFSDPDLSGFNLSSANSINIGRLLPQTMYYFYAHAKLSDSPDEEVVFSVPSGNFGDLMGGLLAQRMGLPVRRFVVATNSNDEFPIYVRSGSYHTIVPSRNCISSAMNVGHPSNVARLIDLYGGEMDEKGNILKPADLGRIRQDMYAVSISDPQTEDAIKTAWENHRLLLEPHGAVGWAGLNRFLDENPELKDSLCVSLETAHPAKFPEKITELLGFDPEPPPALRDLDSKPEAILPMANSYPDFLDFLKTNYGKN